MTHSTRIVIEIVEDETTDVNALLEEIHEQPCTVDVAGYRFTGTLYA